jgi:pyrimidine deaminase RibD-like protein
MGLDLRKELDKAFIRAAIDAARECTPEDARTHPKVGVVVVKDDHVLAVAHRGELNAGEHAEYTALERILGRDTLVGATVYTTLEPCTSRSHPKLPCVERLIDRKVHRVCIGMLDPNPAISGKGLQRLREANIETDLFPPEFMAEVEELNREFARQHRQAGTSPQASSGAQRTVRLDHAAGFLKLEVPVGDYAEIHHRGFVIKVSLEEIIEREFSRSAIRDRKRGRGCHLKLSSGGGLFFCGSDCEQTGVNEFMVPTKEFDQEEPVSVYFFWAREGWHRFFRLFVEHINRTTGVATLNVFVSRADVTPPELS